MSNIKQTLTLMSRAALALGAVAAIMPLWNSMWDACWGAHKNTATPPVPATPAAPAKG